jgi:hypothetical protein
LNPTTETRAAKNIGAPPWTVRELVARHKRISLALAALVLFMVGALAYAAVGSKSGPVTNATTCTQWGSANVNQQTAYAALYLRQHGGRLANGGTTPASVIAAINSGCSQAFDNDVEDNVKMSQAIASGS